MLLYQQWSTLQWRHNRRDGFSSHQPHDSLLKRLIRRISKKTSMLCVTGLCMGNSPATGEFPAQFASNAENVFIWWRHYKTNQKVWLVNTKYNIKIQYFVQQRGQTPYGFICLNVCFTNVFHKTNRCKGCRWENPIPINVIHYTTIKIYWQQPHSPVVHNTEEITLVNLF